MPNFVDFNNDKRKKIEMNGTENVSISADGSSQGVAFSSSLKTTHISDADIDEGKETEINGSASENGKTTQVGMFLYLVEMFVMPAFITKISIHAFALLVSYFSTGDAK